MNDTQHIRTVERNFIEIANAIQKRQALVAVEEYTQRNGNIYFSGTSFLELAFRALFNDTIAHAIKVLDFNKKSATFWYILKNRQEQIASLKSYSQEKILFLQDLGQKLKPIRDKTHFHIDKQGVLDPEKIWQEAGISGDKLGKGLEYLFDMLFEIRNSIRKENMTKNNYSYDGSDVIKLLDLAEAEGLINVQKGE